VRGVQDEQTGWPVVAKLHSRRRLQTLQVACGIR
jgi:hypothetical protein